MEQVRVNIGEGYDVFIASGLIKECGTIMMNTIGKCKLAIVSDSNVAPLYLEAVSNSLKLCGYEVYSFVFPAGEANKNMNTLSDIIEFFAESGLTRADCAIALGGGVTGDMTGFAAGCYMRGIRYVQMPTTLLAAVDSSVGGKTAVDLKAGKNLAGLFIQPSLVICDTRCLGTLPPEVLADGCAEAIKTAVLGDVTLFDIFENKNYKRFYSKIISRCVKYKASIVEADEKETGLRKLLNLGHTAAHGIEKVSGYTVPHGHAVAIGTAMIARAAESFSWCAKGLSERIVSTLEKAELPVTTEYSAHEIAQAAMMDKKRSGDKLTLVIPKDIERCELLDIPVSELESILSLGMGENR